MLSKAFANQALIVCSLITFRFGVTCFEVMTEGQLPYREWMNWYVKVALPRAETFPCAPPNENATDSESLWAKEKDEGILRVNHLFIGCNKSLARKSIHTVSYSGIGLSVFGSRNQAGPKTTVKQPKMPPHFFRSFHQKKQTKTTVKMRENKFCLVREYCPLL